MTRIAINELLGINFFSKVRGILINFSDAIVFLNKETKDNFSGIMAEKHIIRYIPNGVNTKQFTNCSLDEKRKLKAKYGFLEEDKLICFIGIINQRKGVNILIKSFELIRKDFGKSQLLLVGPYEEASEIDQNFIDSCKDFIRTHNLEKHIHFVGRTNNILDYLLISDIFVLPSYSEGMPNVLLEAMAVGLPCIGSDIPGIRELLFSYKNGILFQPGDVDGLSSAISLLLTNEDMCKIIGNKAQVFIKKNHSIDRIAREYKNLFFELLNM